METNVDLMRLPELDPAGSPRVAQNPYVPRLGVPAKRHVAEAPSVIVRLVNVAIRVPSLEWRRL